MMRKMLLSAVFVATAAVVAPASAAPLGATTAVETGTRTADVTKVDYRGFGHCHWRHGRKWCHGRSAGYRYYDGPRYGYYPYYRRPGITLDFGFGGGRHHHRHHYR